MSYESLAGAYDALMADVQYRRRAEYLDRQMQRCRIPVRSVLDLGCGTGTIACLLAQRGYDVIAVDSSEEMLTAAAQKVADLEEGARPLLLHQNMARLRLAEPVDAVVSTVDALNYLTCRRDVQETFRRVYRYLAPGGFFLFDINSSEKLRRMDGQVWLDETKALYCVWRTEFSRGICTYWVDLFTRQEGGAWLRSAEEHRERAWEVAELRTWLAEAGFQKVAVTGDLSLRPPKAGEDRLIFHCEKRL